MKHARSRKRHLTVILAAMLLPLASLIVVRWGAGFDGLYGQDAHEYARYAGALQDWIIRGTPPGWHAWPVGYSLLGAFFSWLTGSPAMALQVISALALGGTALAVSIATTRLPPCSGMSSEQGPPDHWKHGVWLILAVSLSPALLHAGVLGMSDMLAIALGTASIACWMALIRRPSNGLLVACAITGIAAVGTRYGMAVLLCLPALHAIGLALRHRLFAGLGLSFLILGTAILLHVQIKQDDADDLFRHYSLALWSFGNWFARTTSTADGIHHYPLPNLLYVLTALLRPSHLPLLLVLPFVRRADFRSPPVLILWASVGLYFLFLAGIPFQNHSFQVPAHPLVAIALYPAWLRAADWLCRKGRTPGTAFVVVLLVAQIGLAGRTLFPLIQRNAFEHRVADILHPMGPGLLYTFDLDPALRNRAIPQTMVNMWVNRIEHFQPGALILFAPDVMKVQWEGRNPMFNWHHAQNTRTLTPVASPGRDWVLVRVALPDAAPSGTEDQTEQAP